MYTLFKSLVILFPLFLSAQPIFHLGFNEDNGSIQTIEQISGAPLSITNKFNKPERITGVSGNALRLDGYSTHVSSFSSLQAISNKITVEAWYATESFSSSTDGNRQPIKNAAIVSQQSNNAGFALEIGPYGEVIFVFFAGGQRYELSSMQLLKKYTWNHIVAVADLSTKLAYIYVNGQPWATQSLGNHTSLQKYSSSLFFGKSSFDADVFGISATHANGALDEVKIYDYALSPSQVQNHFEQIVPQGLSHVSIYEDFESTSYGDWTVTGNAFGSGPANGTLANQQEVSGYYGNRLVNTFLNGDGTTGTLTSPFFEITKPLINMLVGGGNHSGKTEVRLWIDDEVVRTHNGINNERLTPRSWDVSTFIGKQAQIEIIDFESGGWGHINIDHITFESKDYLPTAELKVDAIFRHGSDYLRPRYHPMPNTSWANEAYGFLYYNDKYHLFFQKNPNGPDLYYMHWGHLSSPDLVDWTEERVVYGPDKYPGYDNWGTWSGTSILDYNNQPILIHTGVNLSKASIGIAYPKDEDLIGWEKHYTNPVIPQAPSGLMDFRDPYVWKSNEKYYMIVGSGKANRAGGAMPLWSSSDMKNWTYLGNLHERFDPEVTGFFWEMPAFIKMKDPNVYAFIVNALIPQGNGHIARGLYWIGRWENEQFFPFFTEPKTFEGSKFDHLSPAIGTDANGQITYVGIIPETRSRESQLEAGWRQTFSIPRVLRLMDDNTLGHYAHPNLCSYRENEVSISQRTIEVGSDQNLNEFSGNQTELKFKLAVSPDAKFKLKVLESPDGNQYLSHEFDIAQNKVILDRRFSSNQNLWGDYREVDYVFNPDEDIYLHMFLDRSVVELFLDNTVAYSSRAYPFETSTGIDLEVTQGTVEIVNATQWDRKAFGAVGNQDICPPEFVPNRLRTSPNDILSNKKTNTHSFLLYPNPAKKSVVVNLPNPQITEVNIFNFQGKIIETHTMAETSEINVSHLNRGAYFVLVSSQQLSSYKKIIIE